jgi:DNA-directed RNA polymerase omega subunit
LAGKENPLARVTIEDCLLKVPNRFALIHLAFQRIKQFREGAVPQVQAKNKEIVIALREIAADKVRLMIPLPGIPLPEIGHDQKGPEGKSIA